MSGELRAARIHPTVFIAAGAVVLGDVTLGPRSSVWFNTVVRGDSAAVAIGEESNLQDNSVVHEDEGLPTLVGARVTVGHRSIVHGCVIEDDCLIGMGSVILSGARIGAGSMIGAASLVREGQVIPAGSLAVGAPARVLGPVTESHRASIRNGSTHYAALARFYMAHGEARGADRRGAVTRDHGPMSGLEWRELVRTLAEGPDWFEARARGADAPRILPLLSDLAAADERRRLPLVEALTRGEQPSVEDSGIEGGGSEEAALDAWRQARAALCRRLQSLGPEHWGLLAAHPTRGPLGLADLVREWVEGELDQRRGVAARLRSGT
jgi:carbonic anhydrase/acetyltransferase-like protein (isoleucine patch superfamily)